jgi:tetratricopeptide (TPR) repeat protein
VREQFFSCSNLLVVVQRTPWIVPFERNPHFTGRESQLEQLEEMLFAEEYTPKIAISGLGGVGKTQLLLELLHRTKDKHKHCSVIWISATNLESVHQAYLNVARELGIPGYEEENVDVKKLVQVFLSKDSAGQWLLVFDNADDVDMWIVQSGSEQASGSLVNYLPKNRQGYIIFTTRDKKIAAKLARNIVDVPEMSQEMAAQLLQSALANSNVIKSEQDIKTLIAELTYLPLAIVQAAAYITENGIQLADYLSLLKEQEEDVIELLSEEFEDDGRYLNIKNPVATTWLISFEHIRRRDALAVEYLSIMSCMDPRAIPQSLLPPGLSRKKEIDAIGMLHAYSFITRRSTDLGLDLHRLVHLATRNWLRKEELLAQYMGKAIARLEEVFPNDDHKNRNIWRTYLPHARYALESNLVNKDGKHRIRLEWRYGMCLFGDGRWNEAENWFAQVVEVERRVLGADHPDTLISMANLAATYSKQGQHDKAEKLKVQVVESSQEILGADHPDTLTRMANLAVTFSERGQHDKAQELKVQVVESSKKILGADHPDTLTRMANLAVTFSERVPTRQGRET